MNIGSISVLRHHLFFLLGPYLFSSFQKGRDGQPYDGKNWDDYQKGRAEREDYQKKTGGSQPGKTTGGGIDNDGRAGDFWGKLILFLVGLLLAIPSFFTAILAGTVLYLLFRALSNPETIDMKRFYAGAFWGMFAYLATAAVLSFFIPLTDDYGSVFTSRFYIERIFLYFLFIFENGGASTDVLLKFHLPCLLVASLVVYVKMGSQLGKLQFLKAIFVVAVILLPSFMGLLYLMEAVLPAQLQYFVTLV